MICPFNFESFILSRCQRMITSPDDPLREQPPDLSPCVLCLLLQNAASLAELRKEVDQLRQQIR